MGGPRHTSGWFGAILSLVFALGVASCGLVVSFDDFGTTHPGASVTRPPHSVRGVASGLEGKRVTLLLKSQPLEIGDGEFVFPFTLADGEYYEVTVRDDPTDVSCSVDMGAGTIAGSDVSGVLVHCASSDALLTDLTLSGLPLSPAFAPRVFDYAPQIRVFDVFTASPPVLTVTATTSHPAAVLTIAGVSSISGKPSAPMTLRFGPNRIVIVVVAPDQRQLHYTVLVNVKVCDYFKPADNTPPVLLPPAGMPAPAFGVTVAISGDTMAVGSFRVVHVFRRSGKTWAQEALLQPDLPPGALGENSALTLALSGDTLVVGALENELQTGAAFVFRRSGTTWTQEAYLKASNARNGALFGCSVALSGDGDTLAVGSTGESSMAAGINGDQGDTAPPFMGGVGAVYVFTRTGSSWSQQAYIKPSNPRPSAGFGGAIALSGETLVSTGLGSAYVFTRSGSTWSQQASVMASSPLSSPVSGPVALSGDALAVVGGYGMNVNGGGALAVYIFTRSGAAWSQQAYVIPSNPRKWEDFGSSLALSGDTLAVSTIYESSSAMGIDGDQTSVSSQSSGAVYRFVRSGTSWSQQAYVKASNTSPGAMFGTSIGLSGGLLVVGAPGDRSTATGINGDETIDQSNPKLGAAYVF